MKFNSQICTSREQSERLLALGLKKETADMFWWQETDRYGDFNGKWHRQLLDLKEDKEHFKYLDKVFGVCLDGDINEHCLIPAWSLHRIIEMMPESIEHKMHGTLWRTIYANDVFYTDWKDNTPVARTLDLYEHLIFYIEWLIKNEYFNKEYLNGND